MPYCGHYNCLLLLFTNFNDIVILLPHLKLEVEVNVNKWATIRPDRWYHQITTTFGNQLSTFNISTLFSFRALRFKSSASLCHCLIFVLWNFGVVYDIICKVLHYYWSTMSYSPPTQPNVTKPDWLNRIENMKVNRKDMNKLIMNYLVCGRYNHYTVNYIWLIVNVIDMFMGLWVFCEKMQKDLKKQLKNLNKKQE